MKFATIAAFATAALITAILATPVLAAPPACPGRYEYVRTDTIKPGKMDLFLKAVHDHQAWYAAHGLPDHILLGRVIDPKTGMVSDTTALTIHTDDKSEGGATHAANDAAWNAYVKAYQDSSTVTNAALICVTPAP
jgi:hypothetical protein